jgi:hypothetical protein
MALSHHICPRCFSLHVVRVQRRGALDRLMRLLGRRVYTCIDCGARFYDRPTKPASAKR